MSRELRSTAVPPRSTQAIAAPVAAELRLLLDDASAPKNLGGRPRVKPLPDDPVALDLLIDRLTAGMSMDQACADPRCPELSAVYVKMARDASYFAIIARAREAQQQAIIDATVDMADKATAEDWQVVRLRIWARQWQAAKLAPKQFGERMRHEVEAEVVLSTPEQRKRRIAALLKKLGRGVPPTIDRPDPARRVGTCHAAWKRP